MSGDWRDEARCRGEDPALFFGPDAEPEPERIAREEQAKAVCSGCPARSDCLEFAEDRPARHGIWGGLTEDERARDRRRRVRRAAAARRAAA